LDERLVTQENVTHRAAESGSWSIECALPGFDQSVGLACLVASMYPEPSTFDLSIRASLA